jgi:hypothetical protein
VTLQGTPVPNWARWGPQVSWQDESRGILGLRIMCSKFGRSGDVRQIDSSQLEDDWRQLWECDGSREEI